MRVIMASRMERYYQLNTETPRRSKRNQALYEKIYETSGEYSNIEGIAKIEKTNEIDINKIKEMLRQREERKKGRVVNQENVKKTTPEPPKVEKIEPAVEKNYDIRDILVKAKSQKEETESDRYHSLKNTQYNILKGINLKDELNRRDYMDQDEDELKELIHTITNASFLNKMADEDLSLDLLSDLKSVDNTQINSEAIQAILKEEKEEQRKQDFDDTRDLDKSFYTSSLNFSDEDFDELGEIKKKITKRRAILKGIGMVVILILVVVAAYFVGKYLL